MSKLTELIIYSLKKFKVAIAIEVNGKLVLLNPRILEGVSLEQLAEALSASDLSDEDIIQALKVVDNARKPPKLSQ